MATKKDTGREVIAIKSMEMLRGDSGLYEGYIQQPFNPDIVVRKKGSLTVYDRMRMDDQIKAVLYLKKFMILSNGWHIIPFKDEKQDDEIEELTNILNDLHKPDFNTALLDILTHIDYGFSITEPVFKRKKDENKIILYKLKTRAPHTFLEMRTDKFGDIKEIIQNTGGSDVTIKQNDLKKLIYLRYQADFGNPFGTSDLQASYRGYFSKDIIIRFWNIFLERFANPHLVFTVPANMLPADKAAIEDIINNFQAKTGMRIPDTVKVEILSGKGKSTGSTDFERAIDKYNMMMARSMLIPDLLGIGGSETSGGSFALGKEQFEMFYKTLIKPREDLKRGINNGIIEKLCLWNFGMTEKCPVWEPLPLSDSDKNDLLKLWIEAVKGKVWKASDEEINHFREMTKFPQGDVDREKAPEVTTNPPEGKNPQKPGEVKDGEEEVEDIGEEKKEDKKDLKKKCNCETFARREKTKHERVVNFTEVIRDLDESDDEGYNLLVPVFNSIKKQVVDFVKTGKIIENKAFKKITSFTLDTDNLQKSFKKIIRNTWNRGGQSARDEIKKLNIPKQFATAFVDLFEKTITERSFFVTGIEEQRILDKVKKIILLGMESGSTVQDVVFELEKFFDADYDWLDIGKTNPAARLENIVRTNTIKAYNFGRRSIFENEMKDILTGYQFSAVIDPRTTLICSTLDGNEYLINDPIINRITPPIHFMCRSLLVPIIEKFTPSVKVNLDDPRFKNEVFPSLKR